MIKKLIQDLFLKPKPFKKVKNPKLKAKELYKKYKKANKNIFFCKDA